MKIGIPLSISLLLVVFLVFYIGLGKERKDVHAIHFEKQPWTNEQLRAMGIFGLVVILWSFKDLIIQATGFSYRDESAAILGAILLFIVPGKSENKPLLEWKDTEKLPWGILLLFGGGLALAAMLEKGGVVTEMTKVFSAYKEVSILTIVLVVVTIAIFATEIMSNLALVTIFVPIVAAFALESGYDIIQLCLPLTLAASCAFMLPVGTPPNAIVFSSGLVKIHQMAKIGFLLNVISVIIITIFALIFI
jgi:sodium-dependent dicarboxylate transporter 2/3/5